MIEIESQLVCYNCKSIVLQKIREGVAISPKISRSKWWKIYFFIILALQLHSFIISSQELLAGENLIRNTIDFVVYPWVLVAIFGYSFNKKLLTRRVWEVLFPIAISTDIIQIYLFFKEQNSYEGAFIVLIGYAILSPLIILQYIALYRYGFSKIEPWASGHKVST
jgi:hypothetical protein